MRRALTNDAIDYLIKNTLDRETLLHSLEKARKKLESSQSIPKSRKNLHSLRQKFWADLLSGMHDKKIEELEEEGRLLNMNITFRNMYPILLGFGAAKWSMQDKSLQDDILVKFSISNVIEEIAAEQQIPCQIYVIDERNYVIIASMEERYKELQVYEELTQFLRRIQFCMQKYLKMSFYYSIGMKSNLSSLSRHYKELEKEWAQGNLRKDLTGSPKREQTEVCEEKEYRDGNGLTLEEEKQLIQALEEREQEKIFLALAGLWRERMEGEDVSSLIRRTLQWIKKHFREEISLNDAANDLQVSVPYLSKCFNEEVKESFPEYLNGLRLEYARELLIKSDKKIKEIAKEAAFYNYPYFITLFKKKYGMTPKEYKKMNS